MKEKLTPALRRLTLRQLRAFASVVRTGTVSGAAEELAVTPPAVSLQLRELERHLGCALVERAPGRFQPTTAGIEVLTAITRIERALAEMGDVLAALKGDSGSVAVGAVSTAKYVVPRILAAFKRLRPRAELILRVGNRDEIVAALERFEIDFAITGRPPESFAVEREAIGDHPHVIIAAPDHPLVGRPRLPLQALAHETFLLRERGSGTRALVDALRGEAGLDAEAGMELGSNETIKQAVMAGMGIALLSAHTVDAELRDGRLATLDIEGLPVIRRWYVIRRCERRLLPTGQALWDFIAREGGSFLPSLVEPRR